MNKILYVCPASGIGGAETFLKQTHKFCDKNQFENHYFLFRTGPLYDYLEENGARVHLAKHPPRLSRRADRSAIDKQLKAIINQYNINLVHSTMAYGALFSARTCKKMKTPHVWFQHGPASGWMDRLASLYPHNGLIVNSHYTGKKQRELENPLRFFLPRCNPIEKILLGTDIEEPKESDLNRFKNTMKSKHEIADNTFVASMLCRIQEWKGVHLFLDALKIIKDQNLQRPFIGLVWGEPFKDRSYFETLEKRISDEKIPAILMGGTSDVALALKYSDAIVNASIQPEPFGLSIIEGMMVGTVPVVPNEGGPAEIVRNGEDGLEFKARQAPSLATKLKALIDDPKLQEKLSAETKKCAEQKFKAERAIEHLEKFHLKFLQK